MALITAPLFGLLRASPLIVFEQLLSNRFLTSFFVLTSFAIVLWSIHISLLYLFHYFKWNQYKWILYLVSIIICSTIAMFSFNLFLRIFHQPQTLGLIFMTEDTPGITRTRMEIARRLLDRGSLIAFMPFIQTLSVNIFIIILGDLILLKDKKQRVEYENSKLKISNLEARHNQLKQQLQPHFLFNSLNTLRALIKREPTKAEEYLERLSSLLRHSINSNGQSLVELSKELDLCENYLNMQKVRFGEALKFLITIPDYLREQGRVPSYSIQLLLENVIKHNRLKIEEPLCIHIDAIDNSTLRVLNNLQPKLSVELGSNIGLNNLSERYKLLGAEEIKVENDGKSFAVYLKIL
jgi:sensor histidine kinase YesM